VIAVVPNPDHALARLGVVSLRTITFYGPLVVGPGWRITRPIFRYMVRT
jgi:hypothetical protein